MIDEEKMNVTFLRVLTDAFRLMTNAPFTARDGALFV
jgi:hypothetical protein